MVTSQREPELPLSLQQRLFLWLRADQGVELTNAASGGVRAWRDLKPATASSGGGHDFIALAPEQQRYSLDKARVRYENWATQHELKTQIWSL
jgi:hypothetical protein